MNNLKLHSLAKDLGSKTIIGGHNATHLAREIISNNPFVDFVIMGDGEKALEEVVKGTNPSQIKNLAFRIGTEVIVNQRENLPESFLLPINYRGIDMQGYFNSFRKTQKDPKIKIKNYQRIYSHKGCANRSNSQGCVFCGRADIGVRFKNPESYLQELIYLQEEIGADYVFDVGDDLLFRPDWLEETVKLKKAKYTNIQLSLACFGRANRINAENSNLLKKLGIKEIFIGFESGDERVTKILGKGSPKLNLNSAEILFREGIDVCAMYVVGLPGEDSLSLENTLNNARQLIELSNKYSRNGAVYASLIEPYPGSPAFKKIKREMPQKYEGKDRLDLKELQEDYIRVYFGIDSPKSISDFKDELILAQNRINNLL